MAIHSATIKRAQKAGIILQDAESPKTGYFAHWPKLNVRLWGQEAKYLLNDMLAIQTMASDYPSFRYEVKDDDTVEIKVLGTDISVTGFRAAAAFEKAKQLWQESRSELDEDDEEADEEAQAEIDDAVEQADEDEGRGGSVVASKYRLIYAERGNPNHCGDWLAAILVEICTNKEGIDTDLFERIALANGVDLSGYRHEGRGWQGRLRMTGRNLMGKFVFAQGGLKMPDDIEGGKMYPAPAEWMAAQKFKKPKAEAAPAVAAPEPAPAEQKEEGKAKKTRKKAA